MSLLDDLKSKADKNDDGRLDKDDLESLKNGDGNHDTWLDKLKDKADQNGDGKVGMDDFSGLKDGLGGMKDKLFGK